MSVKPYLIFSLHDVRYAIAAEFVSEIFLLPELTVVAEAPPDVLGLLNLHSKYVSVMHLDLRFGHKFDRCHVSDSVIVVESQGLQVGLIVHQVETVSDIDDRYIQQDLTYGRRDIQQAFVQSAINLDDEMIILLDVDRLVRHPDALEDLVAAEEAESTELSPRSFYDRYFIDATANTKEILHRRAIDLQAVADSTEAIALVSLAVVSVDGRYFGLDLELVREFINLGRITRIPCCPEHIVGNMNLRGEILTLIDLARPLDLTIKRQRQSQKAVVVEVGETITGIVVEEVHDVIDLRREDLKPVPAAMNTHSTSFLKGLADYQDRTLNVIDLSKLMTEGVVTVELTV